MKSLSIFPGCEVKLFFKQPSQVNAAAKSRLFGDTIQRLVSLLQTLPRGGQAGFGDVARRRSAGFPGKYAGEIPWTHGDSFRQFIHAEVGGEVFEQPRQQIVNGAQGAGLLEVVAAKLQLAAGTSQVHDEILGNIARKAEAVVLFNQRQGEIEAGTDSARGPDVFVLNIEWTAFNAYLRKFRLQGIQ